MNTVLPVDFYDEKEIWPPHRLSQFQWRRLKAIARYAYQNLAFYRERFDRAGIHPKGLKRIQDFASIPTFGKSDVIQAGDTLGGFAGDRESPGRDEPMSLFMTSGTTGTSFLACGRRWRQRQGELLLRAYWWAGLRRGMRILLTVPAWHRWATEESYLVQRLGAQGIIPWGTFLPRYAENLLQAIRDMKPEFISIFLPMLHSLLAECRRQGIEPQRAFHSVRNIICVGAPLAPRSRESLKQELGVEDVFEGAGSSEGLLAMECSCHRGTHIFMDACYVEVVDPVTGEVLPPGTRGRLLLTSLNPFGSIYLRYDLEDLGEVLAEPCPCGRTWPLMKIYDRLANACPVAGRSVYPYDVRACLDELPQLLGAPFGLIRREGGMPYLRVVVQKPSPEDGLDGLEDRLKDLVGQKLQVDSVVEWVEELPARWKGTPIIEERDWGWPPATA